MDAGHDVGQDDVLHTALVVVDYLGLCDRDGGLTAEEEDAAGTVDRVLRVEDAVGAAEPEEAERHDPAELDRAGQGTDEIVDRPPQRRASAGYRAGVDPLEAAEQVPVAAVGEAGEVIGSLVHLLEERRVGIDDPPATQDTVDLIRDHSWLQHVLEHGLYDHAINGAVGQRDRVAVGDELHHGARVDVEADEVDRGFGVQPVETSAHGAAPDDKNPGPLAGRGIAGAEQLEHAGHVGRCGAVDWM